MFGSRRRIPERQRPAVELLEPRVLYSADLTPAALAGGALLGPAEHRLLDQAVETRAQEVVFVDTATPDYQVLIDDITRQAGPGRDIEVILLDGKSDGIEQFSEALSGRSGVSAVHIISHGADGTVQLGAGALDAQTLHTQEALIAGWRDALTPDADLLIYGCDVAATAEGRALIEALAGLTGADVAASTDNTGHAALGGNWDLEYRIGAIEAHLALSQEAQAEWFGLLAAPSLAGANNLGAINEDPASNPGTLVSALIAGQVTDPDAGALTGIAVTAVDNTNGAWQYSTDGGGNWNNFGTPTEASARLLAADANTYVRFVPNLDFNGTVTNGLTFRAWDQTTGMAGGTADLTLTVAATVRDNFDTIAYDNNDGTAAWSAGWVDSDGDPTTGTLQINAGLLRIRLVNPLGQIYREVNLATATSATLSFDYQSALGTGAGGLILLQVSNNGGTSYATIANFSDVTNTGTGTFSADIGAYMAANTRIQFLIASPSTPTRTMDVDNLQISYVAPLAGGSTAFSSATASSSITVNAVNDAPVGTNNTVVVLENGTHVFSAAEFGFTDPNDSPANSLLAVEITTLPGAGTLTNNGSAVTAGQLVGAVDIGAGLLVFTPAAGASGAGYASFAFQVQDDGGGANLDGTARTLTINVNAVAVIVLPPAPAPIVAPPALVPLPTPEASPPPPAADATGKPAVIAQRPPGGGGGFAFDTTVAEGTILPPLVSRESLRGAVFTVGLRTFSPGSLPGEGIAEAVTEIRLGGERMLQLAQLDTVLGRANRPESLANEFDQLRDALRDQAQLQQGVVGALAFGSLSLTVGYVLWILRGGVLVASVLSTLPAWRFLDPLPILAQDDDEDEDQDDSADDDDVAFQAFLDEGVR